MQLTNFKVLVSLGALVLNIPLISAYDENGLCTDIQKPEASNFNQCSTAARASSSVCGSADRCTCSFSRLIHNCASTICYPTGGVPTQIIDNISSACKSANLPTTDSGALPTFPGDNLIGATGGAGTTAGATNTGAAAPAGTSAGVSTTASKSANAAVALSFNAGQGLVGMVLPVVLGFLGIGLGAGAVLL